MSNILRAKSNPQFPWHYKWAPLNELGTPKEDLDALLCQPEATRIKWEVPGTGPNTRGRTNELSADIVPGPFGRATPTTKKTIVIRPKLDK